MTIIARTPLNARALDRAALEARVATHLNTTQQPDGSTPCPQCGGDYGPTMALEDLATYEDRYLPAAPLLCGVCLDCDYTYSPPTPYRAPAPDDKDPS